MPAQITFESYVHRPTEEFISQPKLNNLMKILKTIRKQELDHPENPYLTLQQIRSVTFLQPNQMTPAMNQRGMKVLFDGKGIAFGLSNLGRQVVDGDYQLNLAGIVKYKQGNSNNKTDKSLQPLTNEEFAEQSQDVQQYLRNTVNPEIEAWLTEKYSKGSELLARAIIWKVTDHFTKRIEAKKEAATATPTPVIKEVIVEKEVIREVAAPVIYKPVITQTKPDLQHNLNYNPGPDGYEIQD